MASSDQSAEDLVASLMQRRRQRKAALENSARRPSIDRSPLRSEESVVEGFEQTTPRPMESSTPPASPPASPPVSPPVSPPPPESLNRLTDDRSDAASPLPATGGTIRERMRQRMAARLQRAADAAPDASAREGSKTSSSRRLKGLREATTALARTRFDEDETKEEEELEAELAARSIKTRQKWKRAASSVEPPGAESFGPTEEESFDFFARVWESTPEEEDAASSTAPSTEVKESAEDRIEEPEEAADDDPGNDDDEKKLVSDFFRDVDPIEFVRFVEADYVRRWEREALVASTIYVPGDALLFAEDKLPGRDAVDGDVEERKLVPRDFEDEGFYVGQQPYVTLFNRNKMESRLLREADGRGLKWFRADGRLDALPLPLKTTPTRPPIEADPSEEIETIYVEATEVDQVRHAHDAETGVDARESRLNVELQNLSFTHHHLFSEEHVLALRVQQLHEEYIEFLKRDVLNLHEMKIATLRQSIENLRDRLRILEETVASDESRTEMVRLRSRFESQRNELKQVVQLRNIQMLKMKVLTRNIVGSWKELKALREEQGYAVTGGKLAIFKKEADEEKDAEWWETEIEEAVAQRREDFERERAFLLAEYEKELEKWRRDKKSRKEAAKRLRKRDRGGGDDMDAEADQNEEDEALLLSEESPKPNKPPTFDDERALAEAVEIGRQHWRKPGEPLIQHLDWTVGQPVSSEEASPGEVLRKEDLSRLKVFVRILFNNKEVVKTVSKSIPNDFVVSFNSFYQLQVTPSPQASLKFEVYETTSFASATLLAELFAPLPDFGAFGNSVAAETLQFSSNKVMQHKHAGVGSGVPVLLKDRSIDPSMRTEKLKTFLTTGKVTVTSGWALDSATGPPRPIRGAPINRTLTKTGALGLACVSDRARLRDWISSDPSLDPNDPKNADLLDLVDENRGDALEPRGDGKHFRLDHLHEEFDFCSREELDSNPRFKLLQMRDQKIPEYRNLRMIPAFASEIPSSIFEGYEERLKREQAVEEVDESDPDARRANMVRFMEKVRQQVAERFHQIAKYRTVKDVVLEEEIPNISTLAASIMSLQARFARPLHPVRVPRKTNAQASAPGGPSGIGLPDVRVYVNVLRAFNLPMREPEKAETAQQMTATRGYDGAGYDRGGAGNPFVVSAAATRFQQNVGFQPRGQIVDADSEGAPLLKPFVDVVFQRHSARTSTSEGVNASWNEEVSLPFSAPNDDFSPANLQKVTDYIHVTLFDEVVKDISESSEDTNTTRTVHQMIVDKWLGSIKIPFTTLFFNGKIEGTFRVQTPSVLLGYKKSQDGFVNEQFRSTGNHSYLHFYMTLDPPLAPADPVRERFDSNESEALLRKADEFADVFAKRFPDRTEVTTTVVNLQGKSVFVTRYVRPLQPPAELMVGTWQTPASAVKVARFVARIPSVSDSAFFAGMCDLWSTCDQFLRMMTGDEEEHALLLLNYFLFMGKEAWLALGLAIPEGPTSYVVSKEGPTDFWLWNPTTGVRFDVKDSFCPMTAVHSIVDNNNIWVNSQANVQPARLNFDLNVARDWTPFFSNKFPNPGLSSVQPESLGYLEIDPEFVRSLSEKVERSVRESLMKWRPKRITRWNRLCSQALEKILPKLEAIACQPNATPSATEADMMEPLKPFFAAYALSGFPLNASYTGCTDILDAVYATGLHNNAATDVEFALGVYVHAYPSNVLSVWVYVASLEKIS